MKVPEKTKQQRIMELEESLDLVFPHSYCQFLSEYGSAVVDGFKVLGIPKEEEPEVEEPSLQKKEEKEIKEPELDFEKVKQNPFCPLCQNRKDKGRITCFSCFKQYSRETNRQKPLPLWVKGKFSLKKKQQKEQEQKKKKETKKEPKKKELSVKELSVLEATEILRQKRPDLPETLVAIIFIKDTAVCLDLSRTTAEDAPLVEVDLENNKPPLDTEQTFTQWLEYHTKWEKRFRRAWTRIKNYNNPEKGCFLF